MTMQDQTKLLDANDPAPFEVYNPSGTSSFLIVCDHAGRSIPGRLGDLGVPPAEWERHIAWDIGAAGVCKALCPLLDATCIAQTYSRLVIDCNRRPGHPTSIAPVSDGTPIPGNQNLSELQKAARASEIFEPYQNAIAQELDRRAAIGQPSVLIAMHSFTPVFAGTARAWQAGMLYNRDPRLAHALAALLRDAGYHVGDNEPYQLSDDSDYTVPVHAERRGIPYVEIEIRQDLIAGADGQAVWAGLLADVLPRALHAALAD
jgi:predicted N-formylglutamate amidohydrolase